MCKKLKLISILSLLTVLLAVSVALGAVFSSRPAEAAETWSVRVCTEQNAETDYIDLVSGDRIVDNYPIVFLISDYGATDNYYYFESDSKIDPTAVPSGAWNEIPRSYKLILDKTGAPVNYIYYKFSATASKYNKYIYFRRVNTVTQGGEPTMVVEQYSKIWNLIINRNLSAGDLGVDSVRATYYANNQETVYNGSWINKDLTFVVTTVWMKENNSYYDPSDEYLAYSVDGKEGTDSTKKWISMTTNSVTLQDSLSANVWFRVTDVAGGNAKYHQYAIKVNLDFATPTFLLSAKTRNNANQEIDYSNGAWTASDVVFNLQASHSCLSTVSYSVSVNGGTYQTLETLRYTTATSLSSIRFRATNAAGGVYEPNLYSVKIDKEQPAVRLSVATDDPNSETSTQKNLPYTEQGGKLIGGYANGRIYFSIYNQDSTGKNIANYGAVKFYYAVSINGESYSSYTEIRETQTVPNAPDYLYATVRDEILSGINSLRSYRFYAESAAGKKSDIVEYEVVMVVSLFEIVVDPIIYMTNENNWAIGSIPVYVTLPDSPMLINGILQHTPYTFVYGPAQGDLYETSGDYFADVSAGLSKYRFEISASANAVFIIYAKNAAGKASSNKPSTPNMIMIDDILPSARLEAYVTPEEENFPINNRISVHDADWVNGRITLMLIAKISISGVNAKRMHYATDGLGNPVQDANGNLIWQEDAAVMQPGDTLVEGYKYYYYSVTIPSTMQRYSEVFGFRIYNGAGRFVDLTFTANIDISDISLESIKMDEKQPIPVIGKDISLPPISENFTLYLFSNTSASGHFGYQLYNESLGAYDNVVYENFILITVPKGIKGTFTVRFYLVNNAVNYLGKRGTTGVDSPYVVTVSYDSLNISIIYSAEEKGTPDSTGQWYSGHLLMSVNLTKDQQGSTVELTNEEKNSYTYYYMKINSVDFTSENEAKKNGTWILVTNGSYTGNTFQFQILFEEEGKKSFHGYIALSVRNEAGYESSSSGFVGNIIRIDNTTPDINDIVHNGNGERGSGIFYSDKTITLIPTLYGDRAPIVYYYHVYVVGETAPSLSELSDTDIWKILTIQEPLEIKQSAEIYLYAQNTFGIASPSVLTRYSFIVDDSELNGLVVMGEAIGGRGGYDESIEMYAYWWVTSASIKLTVNTISNLKLSYYYTIDDGAHWNIWGSATDSKECIITFDVGGFSDGIASKVRFMVRSQSGKEYPFTDGVFIGIDTKAPEFNVTMTVNGSSYAGGNTDSLESGAVWVSSAVKFTINMTKPNVSGYRLTYIISYLSSSGQTETLSRELPSYTDFTTDILDGFDINKDALITIYGTGKGSGQTKSVRLRVSVDKIVPVFILNGQAHDGEGTVKTNIHSAEWTNRSYVDISKSVPTSNINVSPVTYMVSYSDEESTNPVVSQWSTEGSLPNFSKISTVTVTATSEAGLTHTVSFRINIDKVAPQIIFDVQMTPAGVNNDEYYIDLKVRVEEANIYICEYITIKTETRGFSLDPTGYIISTSSVDNTTRYDPDTGLPYRGYVKIYVEDYAGNKAEMMFYMLPFQLDVNNVTLSDSDLKMVDQYERDLNKAVGYMESSRVTYFRNLIVRLKDRINTLQTQIDRHRAYLEALSQKISFELSSDYAEMFAFLEEYENYAIYGHAWIQAAITGDASSKYFAYFKNLENKFAEMQAEMRKVEAVETRVMLLPAINMVTAGDYSAILQVHDEYTDLSPDQKSCFTTTLYTKLLTLKKNCEILRLTDESTGIALSGDFAPNATIQITELDSSNERFINAQNALIDTVSSTLPRAVVSIYRIALTGASAQTNTDNLTVRLPIPQDYQQYVVFGVYKLSSQGTLTSAGKVVIEGDGKSLTFSTDELTTFVLVVKADVKRMGDQTEIFGSVLGLELTTEMVKNLSIAGAAIFVVLLLVIIITGIRRRRFLNSYNKAYRASIYRKGVQNIPKGNTVPRQNPMDAADRVHEPKHPY